MAIQDDNTILNKGDLKAYHEAIAPMLGGTFMVRTNNSDFYSTDEKIVGVWIDGKPLYMRTFTTTSLPSGGNGALTEIDNAMAPANMETAFKVNCYMLRTVGGKTNVVSEYYVNDNDRFSLAVGDGWTWYTQKSSGTVSQVVLTVAYTKTTDTAGSATTTPGAYDINFPNTWPANTEVYFGNGLYGQRFTGTIATTTTVQDFTLATLPSATVLVNVGGTLKRHVMGASYYDFAIPYNYENIMGASIGIDVGVLKFIVKNSGTGNVPYDIWVTYTK